VTAIANPLTNFAKQHEFFVGIDSDGCAFDSMEVKHKACFYPATIRFWNLSGVARYARDVWDFVNLYSLDRGCNRFNALLKMFDLLAGWPEAVEAGFRMPNLDSLRRWVKEETKLGNPALEAKVAATKDPVLTQALAWSNGINALVEVTVHDVPPFPHMRECLEKLITAADVMVVSATPAEALQREWQEHDIARYTRIIAGQELGTKKEQIQFAAVGKYEPDRILMIGDALGDYKAAKDNNALFFPINPGDGTASWKRLRDEGIGKFTTGAFRGAYEDMLLAEFKKHLPATPPWQK
jgi:phosphoglycolate phosphatase-like HAD superfamily hydrolase